MGRDCAAGCCPHDGERPPAPGCPEDVPAAPPAERAAHLYACQGWSTYRIAALTGISRQRTTRLLNRSGVVVKPRGAGRPKPQDRVARDTDDFMEYLYLQLRLSSPQVAALTGLADRTVRQRLRARGVPMRTRGRCNREDRTVVAPEILADLYVRSGLPAGEIGSRLGVSRRVVVRAAHDAGLPVRIGGPPPRGGPDEIKLVRALYADPDVRRALGRHGVPAVPAPGAIWERFPQPVPLSSELAAELYEGCGLALHHIELLTGNPAATIRRLLHGNSIAMRSPGGRTPFMQRWRAGQQGLLTATRFRCRTGGPVTASPQPVRGAVIRAGVLVIVKVDLVVNIYQLTAAQQALPDHRPYPAVSPHQIIAALNLTPAPGTALLPTLQ